MIAELGQYNADIVCLQVSVDVWTDLGGCVLVIDIHLTLTANCRLFSFTGSR